MGQASKQARGGPEESEGGEAQKDNKREAGQRTRRKRAHLENWITANNQERRSKKLLRAV